MRLVAALKGRHPSAALSFPNLLGRMIGFGELDPFSTFSEHVVIPDCKPRICPTNLGIPSELYQMCQLPRLFRFGMSTVH